jgi:5-methylcytosine-specific restriction protein A
MAWVHKNRPVVPKLRPFAPMFASRVVEPQAKTVDPIYKTSAFNAWRRFVIARAGFRCEARDDGKRCSKAAPENRMFADHVKELQDGGDPFDPANGQCLCGSHHTVKTMAARAARIRTGSP